jgi:hypothetical protein
MPSHPADTADSGENVLHQLVVGDAAAVTTIVERARTSGDVTTLVAAALFAPEPDDLLQRASAHASTTRDRQVVAIATAQVAGDADLVDALARDHLAEHPDSVLVAWITAHRTTTRKDPT